MVSSEFHPNMHTYIFNGCLRAVNASPEVKKEGPSKAYHHYHFIIRSFLNVPRKEQNIK